MATGAAASSGGDATPIANNSTQSRGVQVRADDGDSTPFLPLAKSKSSYNFINRTTFNQRNRCNYEDKQHNIVDVLNSYVHSTLNNERYSLTNVIDLQPETRMNGEQQTKPLDDRTNNTTLDSLQNEAATVDKARGEKEEKLLARLGSYSPCSSSSEETCSSCDSISDIEDDSSFDDTIGCSSPERYQSSQASSQEIISVIAHLAVEDISLNCKVSQEISEKGNNKSPEIKMDCPNLDLMDDQCSATIEALDINSFQKKPDSTNLHHSDSIDEISEKNLSRKDECNEAQSDEVQWKSEIAYCEEEDGESDDTASTVKEITFEDAPVSNGTSSDTEGSLADSDESDTALACRKYRGDPPCGQTCDDGDSSASKRCIENNSMSESHCEYTSASDISETSSVDSFQFITSDTKSIRPVDENCKIRADENLEKIINTEPLSKDLLENSPNCIGMNRARVINTYLKESGNTVNADKSDNKKLLYQNCKPCPVTSECKSCHDNNAKKIYCEAPHHKFLETIPTHLSDKENDINSSSSMKYSVTATISSCNTVPQENGTKTMDIATSFSTESKSVFANNCTSQRILEFNQSKSTKVDKTGDENTCFPFGEIDHNETGFLSVAENLKSLQYCHTSDRAAPENLRKSRDMRSNLLPNDIYSINVKSEDTKLEVTPKSGTSKQCEPLRRISDKKLNFLDRCFSPPNSLKNCRLSLPSSASTLNTATLTTSHSNMTIETNSASRKKVLYINGGDFSSGKLTDSILDPSPPVTCTSNGNVDQQLNNDVECQRGHHSLKILDKSTANSQLSTDVYTVASLRSPVLSVASVVDEDGTSNDKETGIASTLINVVDLVPEQNHKATNDAQSDTSSMKETEEESTLYHEKSTPLRLKDTTDNGYPFKFWTSLTAHATNSTKSWKRRGSNIFNSKAVTGSNSSLNCNSLKRIKLKRTSRSGSISSNSELTQVDSEFEQNLMKKDVENNVTEIKSSGISKSDSNYSPVNTNMAVSHSTSEELKTFPTAVASHARAVSSGTVTPTKQFAYKPKHIWSAFKAAKFRSMYGSNKLAKFEKSANNDFAVVDLSNQRKCLSFSKTGSVVMVSTACNSLIVDNITKPVSSQKTLISTVSNPAEASCSVSYSVKSSANDIECSKYMNKQLISVSNYARLLQESVAPTQNSFHLNSQYSTSPAVQSNVPLYSRQTSNNCWSSITPNSSIQYPSLRESQSSSLRSDIKGSKLSPIYANTSCKGRKDSTIFHNEISNSQKKQELQFELGTQRHDSKIEMREHVQSDHIVGAPYASKDNLNAANTHWAKSENPSAALDNYNDRIYASNHIQKKLPVMQFNKKVSHNYQNDNIIRKFEDAKEKCKHFQNDFQEVTLPNLSCSANEACFEGKALLIGVY